MTGGIFFPLRMIRDLLDNEPFQLPITLLHGENDGVARTAFRGGDSAPTSC